MQYIEWLPQVIYNHHQAGPGGTVIFSPAKFRDPFNYNFDPLLVMGIDMVGAVIHTRLLQDSMPGFTMRSGQNYSTWWNGGVRTTAYFHNIIGILTEAIGNPTPEIIPWVARFQVPSADIPAPIDPQVWHFRRSVDYSVAANYGILDYAQRYREELLYDIYAMGRHSIQFGSEDHWTVSPKVVAEVTGGGGGRGARGGGGGGGGGRGAGGRGAVPDSTQYKAIHTPERRDPRAYILPSDQPDFPTATRFVNTLRYVGVDVMRATAPLTVEGKTYPTGSYVVSSAQAFRPMIIDQFEPQDYPNDFAYPGAPPSRPYDDAGWTLAYQMGVHFDRILDQNVSGPSLVKIDSFAKPMPGVIGSAAAPAGYLMSHDYNDAFTVINRIFKANGQVYWLKSPMTAGGKTYPAGTFYIVATPATTAVVQKAAAGLGVNFMGTTDHQGSDALQVMPKRIGLMDRLGGSMPSGWTRLELQNFEIPFTRVYPNDLNAGNLKSKYDVIIMPSDLAVGGGGRGGRGGGAPAGRAGGAGADSAALAAGAVVARGAVAGWQVPDGGQVAVQAVVALAAGRGGAAQALPDSIVRMQGNYSADVTIPALKEFVQNGGIIIAFGGASRVGTEFGITMNDHLVDSTTKQHLPDTKFYAPGSVLRVKVDESLPIAAGIPDHVDVFYNNSPVYDLAPDAAAKGVKPIAWFDNASPLRSGWAWGEAYLKGGVEGVQAPYGKGMLYLFGAEIMWRGEPHGTFKFLFNGIYATN